MQFRIFYHIVPYFLVFIIETVFIEAIPQNSKSAKFNEQSGVYQKIFRQGSIDEFLALRPTTKNPNEHKPCIPVQFFKKIVYPTNVYHQNINIIPSMVNYAKPPYNAYGGYFCEPYKPASSILPPGQHPLHNNFWPNLFGGFLGSNNNQAGAALPGDFGIRPVHK